MELQMRDNTPVEYLHLMLSGDLPQAAANNNEDWRWDDRAALIVLTNFWRIDKARIKNLSPGPRRTRLEAGQRNTLQMIQRTWALLGRSPSGPSAPPSMS
jgi:hypothetical protein